MRAGTPVLGGARDRCDRGTRASTGATTPGRLRGVPRRVDRTVPGRGRPVAVGAAAGAAARIRGGGAPAVREAERPAARRVRLAPSACPRVGRRPPARHGASFRAFAATVGTACGRERRTGGRGGGRGLGGVLAGCIRPEPRAA